MISLGWCNWEAHVLMHSLILQHSVASICGIHMESPWNPHVVGRGRPMTLYLHAQACADSNLRYLLILERALQALQRDEYGKFIRAGCDSSDATYHLNLHRPQDSAR